MWQLPQQLITVYKVLIMCLTALCFTLAKRAYLFPPTHQEKRESRKNAPSQTGNKIPSLAKPRVEDLGLLIEI